jgi:hypothetical protein
MKPATAPGGFNRCAGRRVRGDGGGRSSAPGRGPCRAEGGRERQLATAPGRKGEERERAVLRSIRERSEAIRSERSPRLQTQPRTPDVSSRSSRTSGARRNAGRKRRPGNPMTGKAHDDHRRPLGSGDCARRYVRPCSDTPAFTRNEDLTCVLDVGAASSRRMPRALQPDASESSARGSGELPPPPPAATP